MKLVLFFLPQGMIIGEEITLISPNSNNTLKNIKNPALIVIQGKNVALGPFLGMTEENIITISIEEVAFKQFFTPKMELVNVYNQMFGSGLMVANHLPNNLPF